MALSRERIADELVKLLALPDPAATLALMIARGILRPVLPEMEEAERLRALIAAEAEGGFEPDAIRRLSSLLPRDPDAAAKIATRLKLSNKARKRIGLAAETDLGENPQALAYWIGAESAADRLLLAGRTEDAAALIEWPVPRLPISGDPVALDRLQRPRHQRPLGHAALDQLAAADRQSRHRPLD